MLPDLFAVSGLLEAVESILFRKKLSDFKLSFNSSFIFVLDPSKGGGLTSITCLESSASSSSISS